MARAHRPGAITLDVMMPQMDGWSALVALKADPDLRDIPVIMLTMLKDRGLAFTLGASDFMTKPVDRAASPRYSSVHRPSSAVPSWWSRTMRRPAMLTRAHAGEAGLGSREASNGPRRWMARRATGAGLILLDLMMPVMDGFAVSRAAVQRSPTGE